MAAEPFRGWHRAMLRALTLMMPLVASGCATYALWGDNRTYEYDAMPKVRAFRVLQAAQTFVVALDEPAVAKLRKRVPEGAAAAWLEVRLPLDTDPSQILARHSVELWLVHEPGAPVAWYVGERGHPNQFSPPTLPTRLPCDVRALPVAPAELGEPIEQVQVVDVVVLDDGTSLGVQIAATPLTVFLDGLTVGVGIAGIVFWPIVLVFQGL